MTIQHPMIVRNLLVIVVLALLFSGCRKYEDGPTFSLRSKKARVVNNWDAHTVARNNIDETEFYDEYNLNFNDNGEIIWTVKKATDTVATVLTAQWELASVKEQIKLTFSDIPTPGETTLLYMDILKLEEKEMWLRFLQGGDYYNIQMD